MSVTDFRDSARVAAGGTATIRIRPNNRREWIFSQIAVELTYVSGAKVLIKKNGFVVTPIILDTQSGTGTAGGYPPVKLLPGDTMTVEFSGLTAGTIAKVYGIYEDGT